MAVEILDTGAKGVGLLDSVSGLAAILGGIFAIARATKHKLGQDLIVGRLPLVVPLGRWSRSGRRPSRRSR